MVSDGHTGSITNVDISTVITEYMRDKHADLRPSVTWVVGDVTRLTYGDCTFDAAIDKGTMDALMVRRLPGPFCTSRGTRGTRPRKPAHLFAPAVRQRLDRQHGRHGA